MRGGREGGEWPGWLKGLITVVLGFHGLAVATMALAANPSSELERSLARPFLGYLGLIAQDHAHRYYAPAPPPTPVVSAEVRFGDGREPVIVRLPDRSARPRLKYQRQLALANHLYQEHRAARSDPHGSRRSVWGASYARHLAAEHPGATVVTIRARLHLVPDPSRMSPGDARRLDPDADRFYTVPELVGDYPCDPS